MPTVFERVSLNGMNLRNRFVRSATWEGLAAIEGLVTPRLTEMMVELAKGGVGLIITGYTFVSPEGQSSPRQMAIHDDRFVHGLKAMVQAVHNAGGKIALQIVHGGAFADKGLSGLGVMGPSDIEKDGQRICTAMTMKNIADLTSAFTNAAVRAKQVGFDAVQIHAAHGFLISQFLSSAFNRRTDEYGGGLSNRSKLLLEVVKSIRMAVGQDFPVLIKLNSEDFLEGGLTREEAVQVACFLEEASIDAIEYSGGTVASALECIPPRPGALKTPESEVYYREAATLYKEKLKMPLMLVGGIRSIEVAENLIQSGTADYIALSRPLISEPNLIKRWQSGDNRKADCISCNACFGPASEGHGLYCVVKANKKKPGNINPAEQAL